MQVKGVTTDTCLPSQDLPNTKNLMPLLFRRQKYVCAPWMVVPYHTTPSITRSRSNVHTNIIVTMKAPSYLTPALPCLLSLLLGVPVAVQGGKGSSCSKAYCCTADDSESFTTFFLLEFKDNFPSSPQCQSVRRNMERQFVLSYNYIVRNSRTIVPRPIQNSACR